jgi:transglutaminase-like putative cysteine protease
MRKNLVIAAIMVLAASPVLAQNISYVLSSVSEPVKKNAHVITRYKNQVFEVTDLDKATLTIHDVTTVVDREGMHALRFGVHTSKERVLDEVEIKVYDAFGKQINKYRKKDMHTQAVGEGLIDDGFYTYFSIPAPSFPVTVETKYEIRFKGTLFYPTFHIISPGEGVEISSFTAKVPKDLDLRYKDKNISLKPEITEDAKSKMYKWTVTNLSPVADEEGAVSSEHRFPSVQLAPNKFSLYGSEGDISSWKNFGLWARNLFRGLDELPEAKKAFFRDLVKNAKDEREKVRIIYEYLQKNFRYVSIQLGIGGFRPFSAEFTDNKKYGDCKALSNYMRAALKAVGIESHPAWINAQYNGLPVDPSFPRDNFNHVILCVPQPKDSIWLECTSSTAEFGVLGSSTENRNALLLTDEGGILVPTPVSKPEQNCFNVNTIIQLKEDASGTTETMFKTNGRYRQIMEHFLTENKDDQKEYFVRGLGFKQPDEFEFKKKEAEGMHTTTLVMALEKVPEFVAGNKMFISPRLYKLSASKLPKAENRKLDYYFYNPFEQNDTTVIQLPAGYTMDALPTNKELSCAYATYSTKYWFNEEQKAIYSSAKLVLKQQKIPAASYAEVKKFFDEILLDDSQRIVVKKL